ncbi:unnamed protein product [Phytophthora fragariaefolia]|uniref:Unnamed protein product n=1 Tax=Phytophthora fragariaefolia TaxID=1490495 RepID=A0A9W6XPD2_9STRA|nr:unnamed protein product [Phytophthora fragariaefolia]
MAEWRVGQRRMMPGETYTDFAAALRDLCGSNRIKERVLLAQFYRSLDRTTRLLVKQRPKPTTLEEAVEKATEINDPIDNVAQGMENIGQAFVTAPDSYIVPASGTTGHMALIPGVAPKGRVWNGHLWAPLARKRAASTAVPTMAKRTVTTKTDRKAKVNMATGRDDHEEESEDDQAAGAPYSPPPAKKSKLTVRHSKATVRQAKGTSTARTQREAPECSPRSSVTRAEARAEAAGKRRSSGVGGSRRPTEPGTPQQPVRKMRNDSMVHETDGTTASMTAVGGDGEPKVDENEGSRDESMAVVRRAVAAHVDEELAVCDHERADRYVSTVRSAMAALRYAHEMDDKNSGGQCGNGGVIRPAPTRTTASVTEHPEQVSASEEGDELTTGEGAAAANDTMITESSPLEIGTELTSETMTELGNVARVRMAVKRSKRVAKLRRAQRAREKADRGAVGDDEVARVVAELKAERELRRLQQARDARAALDERRLKCADADGGEMRTGERAHVNLVWLDSTANTDDDDNDDSGMKVEAGDGLPTATMIVDEVAQHAKIDSGARYSVAGKERMMRGERKHIDAPKVMIDGCIIAGCTDEFLIGVDFLESHRSTMDFDRRQVRYDERGHKVIIPFRTTDAKYDSMKAAVRLACSTNLHRRTVQSVEVAIAAPDGEEGIFQPTVNNGAVLLASTVTKVNNGKALIPAINTYGGRIRLPSRKELGVWVHITRDIELLQMHGELQPERVQAWLDELGDTVTPLDDERDVNIGTTKSDARALVLKLLRAYRDLADAKEECPSATTLNVEHHIGTGDAAPIMMRRRRQAQTEDAMVDSNVDTMLSAGVIEPGEGARGFPGVLVRKKDGAFTTLDLRSGYWQIRVAEEDRDKTAFMTKRGLYRFRRMPFGLTNAPATFQLLMNGVLRGLTWMSCLVYLDDIIIFTKGSIEQHVIEVAGVLERLRAAGLSLKLVHLAGYYRKFIAAFGAIVEPLTRLLKKDIPWEWSEAQEFAFGRVKMLLTTRPWLLYPNFELPFRLVTDACKVGLGACLMQDHGRGRQPIAYGSKVNSTAETNYSITVLESLAVVWSVKMFRPYLYGRAFTIITDHAALKWLMTRPNLAGRLHRWSLVLQEYEFQVEYRPGATNVVADALSTAPASVRVAAGRHRHHRPPTGLKSNSSTVEDCTATISTAEVVQTAATILTATADEAAVHGGNDEYAIDMADTLPMVISSNTNSRMSTTMMTGSTTTATRQPVTNEAERRTTINEPMSNDTGMRTPGTENATMVTTNPDRITATTSGRRRAKKPAKPATRRSERIRERAEEHVRGATTPTVESNAGSVALGTKQPPTTTTTLMSTVTTTPRNAKTTTPTRTSKTSARTKTSPMSSTQAANETATKHAAAPENRGSSVPMAMDDWYDLHDDAEHEHTDDYILQLSDDEVAEAQKCSKFAKRLLTAGIYSGMNVVSRYGLVTIWTANGWRVVLPPTLWPAVFKEMHGSVWSGHLRGPHTYGRVTQLYWWPGLYREVRRWVRGCPECTSRKAKPRDLIPPLRSLRGGAVGDRWTLDVAGPFPIAAGGERYVIAAVEYVTRYAMAGKVIEELVQLLQAHRINPVPYRPQLVGLVERFHRSWKDCVATFMQNDDQADWNLWVKFAVHMYNSARHSTVAISPNELMMGRRLRAPNELLRRTELTEAGELTTYHAQLMKAMDRSHECAERARRREQERQARVTPRVALWWNVGDDDDAIKQVSTYSNMSCCPVVTRRNGRPTMETYGLTREAMHDLDGPLSPNTNDFTETTGSWKTLVLMKACKEAGTSETDETVGTGDAPSDDVEVPSKCGTKPRRPRARQDRLHGGTETAGSLGPLVLQRDINSPFAVDRALFLLRSTAHFPFCAHTRGPSELNEPNEPNEPNELNELNEPDD